MRVKRGNACKDLAFSHPYYNHSLTILKGQGFPNVTDQGNVLWGLPQGKESNQIPVLAFCVNLSIPSFLRGSVSKSVRWGYGAYLFGLFIAQHSTWHRLGASLPGIPLHITLEL